MVGHSVGERIFDREQRRLRPGGVHQLGRRLLAPPLRREQQGAQVAPDMALEHARAVIDRAAHNRFAAVMRLRHARILRALAREHEHHGTRRARDGCADRFRIAQRRDRGRAVGRVSDERAAMAEGAPPDMQREGRVR